MYDIELRYVASFSVAAFHAATHALCGGEIVDPQAAAALADSIKQLRTMLESAGEPMSSFSRHATPLAGQIENNQQLGTVIFRKCSMKEDNVQRDQAFARCAAQLERAIKELAPDLLDELEVQARPLRAEWTEWGPQLLTAFAHQTCPQMLAPRADVFLTHNFTDRGGRAFVPYNSVLVELNDESTEATPKYAGQIPLRVLTLAWNLTQLNTDLPMYAENLSRGGNEKVGALATIPAILAAAESMGVGQCTEEAIAERLEHWRPDLVTEEAATTVWNWWQTYVNGEATWPVAMIALDRMLHPACQRGHAEFQTMHAT